ncbi:MAG: hypothetical protein QHH19_02785 [Candidatus Thermoplasmatota archaeon]|jgi:fimbrial isopeptide formation D2 family protein|nr:hypothetical protein [Candidatus Thermoplasmatota archaeon]
MERKTKISLIMTLLMISSTIFIATPSVVADDETFSVIKQVYNGEHWVDYIEAVYGDIVKFRITTTYTGKYCVENIVVTDNLPNCLEYIGTVQPEDKKPVINGNIIVWDFGETKLLKGQQLIIEFNAKVVGLGENVNSVAVTAKECCTDKQMHDNDTATVFVNPSVEVEKKVWDPDNEKWVKQLDWVIKGQKVRFQITITYHGTDLMKCMVVEDSFSSECECNCLDYADNVKITYPSTNFDPPEITVSENLKYVKFDWTKSRFNLNNGESIVIEFDAIVIGYCQEEYFVKNYACVDLWSCECCTHLYGSDYATVFCTPHAPIFNKKVYDGENYVEKADVYVNDTIKYKIDLTYYGVYNLTEIRIMDKLPCVLEHVDENAKLTILRDNEVYETSIKGDISENKKIAWWNLTEDLEDGDTMIIVFNVLVTGITGDCEECGINTASYTAYSNGNDYSGSDTAQIYSTYRPPAPPIKIDINLMRTSIGRVCGSITNTGDENLSNVKCNILVSGGVLKRVNLNVSETFKEIKAGGSASICTRKRSVKCAFGKITVKVTVLVGDKTFEENFKGFVLGRIVRLKPVA